MDQLVDCWAGCANVLVQQKDQVSFKTLQLEREGGSERRRVLTRPVLSSLSQDWSSYLELGPESWKRIGDSAAKRQVGLRFLYNVGSLDPGAYEVRSVSSRLLLPPLGSLFIADSFSPYLFNSPSKSTSSPSSSKPSWFLPPVSPSNQSSAPSSSTSIPSPTYSPISRLRRTRMDGSSSTWTCSKSRGWIS